MDHLKPPIPVDSASRRKHAKLVQVVQNFFTKTLLVIVQARLFPEPKLALLDQPDTGSSKINKWFNLHLPSIDNDWARQELAPWKSHADLAQFPPMIIETYLDLRQLGACEVVMLEDEHGASFPVTDGGTRRLEVVLERWLVEFDRSSTGISSPSDSNSAIDELPSVYKQAIVLLRVLYGAVRLLPAHKARKYVCSLACKNLAMRNRVVDGKQPVTSKGRVGLSRSIIPCRVAGEHMAQREFAPIRTSLGTLRVSVAYRNHYKFSAQDHEERLLNHFILTDRGAQEAREGDLKLMELQSSTKQDVSANAKESKVHRGSFGQFREKYSILPCTSELHDAVGNTSPRTSSKKPATSAIPLSGTSRPSIQPFKVGSIGSSSSPPYSTLASVQTNGRSSSMERRISITSNRSGSNASLVALLRNPRGSASSSNTPIVNVPGNNLLVPRPISSSYGSQEQESTPNTPRFSSSFGSRQSRRFSNTSAKNAGSNTEGCLGTSVELASSSMPFSGLYADDDISSFVQMIDGTSELRLSNSNYDSKSATPANDGSAHFEALNRFHLLKSQYQQIGDSVSASLVLQHNQSRSPLDERLVVRRSSHSTGSPAPSLPVGSCESPQLPSIVSRLSKLSNENSPSLLNSKAGSHSNYASSPAPNLVAHPLTVTTIAHASHAFRPAANKVLPGPATTPSVYDSAREGINYEDVFEEDDEGIDYFASLRGSKNQASRDHNLSFDNDDLLFEMTDTK